MLNAENTQMVGKRIKAARVKAKLTQSRLHEMTGISITQISAYENGKRNIGLASLKKIADATNSTIDELYCGSAEERICRSSCDTGKLIINCITTLFDAGVIAILPGQGRYIDAPNGPSHDCRIGFCGYLDIFNDYVWKLADFEKNKSDYSRPLDFRAQLIEAAIKRINDAIEWQTDDLF